ncbi:hypothetical protein [Glaciecola sp. MF2-115]|uniref:hypothetical protein n=1 Tax=Glaciecola sp. MF2-115 TaxID=3384827 RepID=UPI0039A1515F
MKYLLLLCLLVIGFDSFTKEHTVELTEPKFDLILDKYFIRTIDFASLSEKETIHLTYWGSTPSAEIRQSGKTTLLTASEDTTESVSLKFNGQIKLLTF